jgi:hypothetical protein
LLDRDAEPIVRGILSAKGPSKADEKAMNERGFFLLSTDLDDLLGIRGGGKPLKALDAAFGSEAGEVPDELKTFIRFVREKSQSSKGN